MPPATIDLRSDTVTRPTAAMRAAMAAADVGDDVLDADPTVAQLERRTADLLGKEAALFVPSGTMSNQVAIRLHCRPGDELLCEADCHIFHYEQGGFAQLSGVVARPLPGVHGRLRRADFEGQVRPDDAHFVRTRLVTLENTHNRGAGSVQPYDDLAAICQWARAEGLRTHLDGARLFNAVVASGIAADRWAGHFDTVSVCFSKGLGAPVGSALAGDRALIREARRHRKVLGGGMRQAGIIAAGALYALEHHRDRLVEDHAHAQLLAEALRQAPGLCLVPDAVETNILIFEVDPALGTAATFVAALEQRGVRLLAIGPRRLRAVTHLDVTRADALAAARVISDVADQLARNRPQAHRVEPGS